MLDSEVKRYINNARDILVGKVPNPQSQVDLITTSLIYKFMDDMDLQSVELGGKRTFFTDDLEKYAFSKLLDPKLGKQGRLNLYAEALDKLPTAASVPELFRTIFKGAFLPFRDPATLTMFLKEINNFSYDNSESLGNAFEYLLSIMGSQGDAGQFRTPRHIIDFVVAVVKPAKEDAILDPACGTAGFLISAFKYILAKHTKTHLTPMQMKTLTNNIVGYDISPDMRKLALVNLYLHQFMNPKIYEYDTLTSEERWTDKFDVILANPPFMTPKGGIIPHNKFSMKANRAEVLFVDYIMEHLTLNGRAGVIVPEGIIFQSATAYKALRKLLVDENYLYAVASLPGGVFQPYSGVKTSILFMDRQIAKQKKDILFVKIENDGFDLGAQRRSIEKNDLPAALAVIEEYRGGAQVHTPNASIVPKTKIAENGEYNLTASRYVETAISNSKYEMVRLGDIANVSSGNSAPQKQSLFENGSYPFCRTADVGKIHISSNFSDVSDKLNEEGIKGLRLFSKDTILFPKSGASILLNHRVLLSVDSYVSSHLATIYRNEEKVLSKYLFYILCQIDAKDLIPDSDYPSLKISDIENIKIPLPSIAVQKKIVAEIENKQTAIDHARKIIDSLENERQYFMNLLDGVEFEEVELGSVANLISGFAFKSELLKTIKQTDKDFPVVKIGNITINGIENKNIEYYDSTGLEKYLIHKNDILLAMTGATVGKLGISQYDNYLINQRACIIRGVKINHNYLACVLKCPDFYNYCQNTAGGGAQGNISPTQILRYILPLPSLADQQRIVEQIETEEAVIAANKRLVDLMQAKIDGVIKRIYREK